MKTLPQELIELHETLTHKPGPKLSNPTIIRAWCQANPEGITTPKISTATGIDHRLVAMTLINFRKKGWVELTSIEYPYRSRGQGMANGTKRHVYKWTGPTDDPAQSASSPA